MDPVAVLLSFVIFLACWHCGKCADTCSSKKYGVVGAEGRSSFPGRGNMYKALEGRNWSSLETVCGCKVGHEEKDDGGMRPECGLTWLSP